MQSEKTTNSQIRIRNAAEGDVAFIFNSWLRCYRSSRNTEGVPSPVFFANQHKVIEGLLKSCTTIIACNPTDPAQIYGYVVTEIQESIPVVHFAYVKESYRKLGIAKELLTSAQINLGTPFFYTHRTLNSDKFEKKYTLVYNPYLAYYAFSLADKVKGEVDAD